MPEAAGVLREAMAARRAQDMVGALEAASLAARMAPTSPDVITALAQIRFEAGLPAADTFAAALRLAPERPAIARNHALALVAEGAEDEGLALLEATVAAHPRWIEGHRVLAGLRTTLGHEDFTASFRAALAQAPGEAAIWLGWFHALATARRWDAARQVLEQAAQVLGETRAIVLSRLFLAGESGEKADDPALFDAVDHISDPGLDLARVRHFLRTGQVARAREVALAHVAAGTGGPFWPYLGLAWRLLDDPQAHWLDRDMEFVRMVDLPLGEADMAELADLLRGLHRARAPWHEQSVRGGTQTDRPLLMRIDPVILRTRRCIEQALVAYVAALPPPDRAHPLLGAPRKGARIAGSWSVRLAPGGFHATHTHPMGWISSAFYVGLPPGDPASDAGHLAFGVAPPELGLDVPRYGTVAPVTGRLVLFPSTLWHGTVPFAGEERLTIAFDAVPAG